MHLNRRPSEDIHDAFELFDRYFKSQPSFVFKGGGLSEDDAYLSREEVLQQKPTQAIKELETCVDTLLKVICTKTKLTLDKVDKFNHYDSVNGNYITHLVFAPSRMLIRVMHLSSKKYKNVFIYSDVNEGTYLQSIIEIITEMFPIIIAKKDEIKIISQESGGFYMTSVNLSKRQHKFNFDNYNTDFKSVSTRVIKELLVENASGLILFHGDIGTGKTSYIKHLLNVIDTKQIIYLPPDLTSSLSSPSFVNFLITNATNSILLIEDAENVLKHREAGGSQAVSNILNISDGILGDVLKTQIVCTFNCPRDQLDKALFRPGRLLVEYEFKKLTAEKTQHLMKKLYSNEVKYEKQQMSLAEIYNFEKMPDTVVTPEQKFGFI